MRRAIVTIGAALLVAACDGSEPVQPGIVVDDVGATLVEGGVQITNRTAAAVAYVISNGEFPATFVPCQSPTTDCTTLPVGGKHTLMIDVPRGPRQDQKVAVHWWHVVPDGNGGYRAGDLRTVKPAAASASGDSLPDIDFPESVHLTGRVIAYTYIGGTGPDSLAATGVAGASLRFTRNVLVNGSIEQIEEGTTTSNAQGEFVMADLPGGYYIVTPTLPPDSPFVGSANFLSLLAAEVSGATVVVFRKP
jgi:hypothetical protein